MSTPPTPEPVHGVRWGVVTGVTAIGLIVTGAPYVLAGFVDDRFGDWQVLLAGTLTSVGTILLLVAAVWLLERTFAARITSAVQETAKATVAQETSALAAGQRDLALRLDELQVRLNERVERATREQDAIIRALSDRISYESVKAALEQADALGALWFHEVTIPAGDGAPNLPRFVFRWGARRTGPWLDEILSEDNEVPRLTITHEPRQGSDTKVRLRWGADHSADEILGELRQGMIAAGFAEESKVVDASLFTNLHAALREAVAGRRGDPGAWLEGALDEWITNDWAITAHGLEHRGPHGMRSDQFPVHWDGRSNQAARTWKQPPAPDGIDGALWDFLIRRARRRHREGLPVRV